MDIVNRRTPTKEEALRLLEKIEASLFPWGDDLVDPLRLYIGQTQSVGWNPADSNHESRSPGLE